MSKKGFLQKAAAFTMTGTMLLSGACTVWAGPYADAIKADMEIGLSEMAAKWDENLEKVVDKTSGTADISVHLGNTGSSLIRLFSGMDLTWLDRLGFKMDFEIVDGVENADVNFYANEQTLASILMAVDMLNGSEKIMVKEASPNAMSMDLTTADGGSAVAASKIMVNAKSSLPDGSTVKELTGRYCGIIFDHMQDGETGETALSVGEITEACTYYEGIMDGAAAQEAGLEILNTAKEDEQLAQVVKNLEASSEDLNGLYDNMISVIDEYLSESENAQSGEETLTSRIYVNADGKLIGSEFSFDEDLSCATYLPTADGKTGLEISFTVDGETYGIAGTGTVNDGAVDGTYQLMANGVAMLNAEVAGLKEDAGTITLSLAENMPDEETYGMLGGFQIVCSVEGDDTSGNVKVELLMNGESLGDLQMSGKQEELTVDMSALDSAKVYDAANEEEMAAYMSEFDYNAILENVTAAGAPEGFVENLLNMIMGNTDDSADGYEPEEAVLEEEAEADAAA